MTSGAGNKIDAGVMREFWDQRATGLSYIEAAEVAGISETAARSAVHRAGGIAPRRAAPSSGMRLSFAEREEIAVLFAAGHGVREIARGLERAPSTISRELRRNRVLGGQGLRGTKLRYRASTAQGKAEKRAARPKPAKLAVDGELRERVQAMLLDKWSPEQISVSLRVEFPDRPEMWVSHETIYQSLYVQSRGALRRELTACLRTGRAVRRPKRRTDERRGRIKDMIMISERAAEADDRSVPGHWEGDLIIGKDGRSAIGTLVERSSRYCLLLHLPVDHSAEAVRDAMLDTIAALPESLRRSLTWDQGREMARHAEISTALNLPIYFCDPHSPWQRGSNENTNGLLRQYFPKGTDLSIHTREDLDTVADQLNQRPRKTLIWQTPAQRLNELLLR